FLDERCTSLIVRGLWDDPRGESEAMWKDMAQLGWLGLSLPEAYGGSGLGMVETAILLDEMGRAAYPGLYLPTVLAAHAVDSAGTTEQKNRWLPAIATGGARATTAFVDADLAWDPQSTATRAEKVGAGWRLSGAKPFGAPGNGERLVWELRRRAAVAAAAEMLGAARRCLDMSVGYAKVREQFGQPIGSFQAIRHKCAEMLLSVENSHAAVYYAAWALDA